MPLSAVHDAVKGAVGHAVDHAEAKGSSGHQETVREVGPHAWVMHAAVRNAAHVKACGGRCVQACTEA